MANGTYLLPAIELQFASTGQYQLVVVADSIASPLSSGVIDVQFTGSASAWDKVRSYLVVAGLFLLCASIGIGNSMWHRQWWMVVSLLVCVLGILLTIYVIQSTFAAQRILLYILFSMCGAVLMVLLLKRCLLGRDPGFLDVRTQSYVMYVRNMFNGVQRRRRLAELEQYKQVKQQSTLNSELRPGHDKPALHRPPQRATSGTIQLVTNADSGASSPTMTGTGASGHARGGNDVHAGGPGVSPTPAATAVPWSMCGYCQATVPEVTCNVCREVYCRPCSGIVHRGRVAGHRLVPGVAADVLPAANLAAQRARDDDALVMASVRSSYIVTMRHSIKSCAAQWRLWMRTFWSNTPATAEEVIDANPEVSCAASAYRGLGVVESCK